MAILISIIAFFSTFLGGIVALKNQDRLHLILGFTAGALLGVVSFDIFPEMIEMLHKTETSATYPMLSFVVAFLLFHILEKSLLVHHSQEEAYATHSHGEHKHPHIGVFSAIALIAHSFLDGVGIGIGFQISSLVGIAIAFAVIAHDFSDGLNTVSLLLAHKNKQKTAFWFLLLDALAPIAGAASTLLFAVPESIIILYLGFFAGFLLYIGAADILPEAHSKHTSLKTIGMTILGVAFMFVITSLLALLD